MNVRRKVNRVETAPGGLLYFPEFLTQDKESALLHIIQELPFKSYVFEGYEAKRKVKHFGYSYDFFTPHVREAEPFPDWLKELRDSAATFVQTDPEKLQQALVAYYPVGAAIGWHRDAPAFGEPIIGISLASNETMRFRKESQGAFQMYKQELKYGSLYVLSGAARSVWKHSIAGAKEERYSITFRVVRPNYLLGKQTS